MGTISAVVSFDDEETFLTDMQSVMELFYVLSQKYNCGNVILDVLTWDSITVRRRGGEEVSLFTELPSDVPWVRMLEREINRIKSTKGEEELDVDDIEAAVERVNETFGEEVLRYDAHELGLKKNQAYMVIDVAALYYLESVVEPEEEEALYDATKKLSKWLRVV